MLPTETSTFAASFIPSMTYFLLLEIGYFIDLESKHFRVDVLEEEKATYDFVIVGAGTSGCILANRLSVNHRVLLLEAGPPPPSLISIPALYYSIENLDAPINSIYRSTPQEASFDRVLECSVGTMLGGSYSHNAMIFNRGSRYDYDNWAEILGDESFNYKNMLKYFKGLENYTGEFPGRQRGTQGLIPVETGSQPISDIWFSAGEELGYPKEDPVSIPANIFTPMEVSRRRGRRCTTYTEYIQPILSRTNLKVIPLAVVEKIKFTGKTATEVTYTRQGITFRVKPRLEIILTAGTFGTAILLFKSGLGPKRMLEMADIPVVADLPIGQNFEDHAGSYLQFTHNDSSKFYHLESTNSQNMEKYLKGEPEDILSRTREGPQAFIASTLANSFKGQIWPDLQLSISGTSISVSNGRPAFDKSTIGKVELNVDAYRRGERESTKLALIDYKIVQNKHINSVLIEGLKIGKKIIETRAFKSIGAEIVPHGACSKKHQQYSDNYWNCYLKNTFIVHRHPAGTCPMANSNRDENGVVDRKFRIFGLSRIRIADASILPRITNANINVAVAAMAEKAAEEILTQYGSCKVENNGFF